MKKIKYKNAQILFGNKNNSATTIEELKKLREENNLKKINFLNTPLKSKKHIFLHQTHSNNGFIYKAQKNFKNLKIEGDFLITQEKNIAIGVLTADCIPILIYDEKNQAVAAIHAGWKGNIQKIIKNCLKSLNNLTELEYDKLKIFIGPAAKKCCLEVSNNFLNEVENLYGKNYIDENLKTNLIKKNCKTYFDNVNFAINELQNLKINKNNINLSYNLCTICNDNFGSYRKYKFKSPLQASIIWIK